MREASRDKNNDNVDDDDDDDDDGESNEDDHDHEFCVSLLFVFACWFFICISPYSIFCVFFNSIYIYIYIPFYLQFLRSATQLDRLASIVLWVYVV